MMLQVLKPSECCVMTWHDTVCCCCSVLSDGKALNTLAELESIIISNADQIDTLLIKACRALVAAYLVRNQDMDIFGISLKEAILASYPQCRCVACCIDACSCCTLCVERT
jgi:hypothetical protein